MGVKRQPREVWHATRRLVLARDGFKCVRCSVVLTEKTAHIDHIKSGRHGTNHMSNLRTLCPRCHVLRSDPRHRGMIARALRLGIIPPDWRELVWDD